MNLYIIKNMVCPRCIETVKNILSELNIPVQQITLGSVTTSSEISLHTKKAFTKKLMENGFELLENNKAKLINQIKTVLIEQIHHSDTPENINYSQLITSHLPYDYAYLIRLFSSVEGLTIEKFIVKQKIEKVKELLFYKELTLSEIALEMGYSSTAYLSSQFKKETGMTPTQFKHLQTPQRKPLDSI